MYYIYIYMYYIIVTACSKAVGSSCALQAARALSGKGN